MRPRRALLAGFVLRLLVCAAGCGFDGTVLSPAPGSFGAGAGVFAGQELTCALAGGRARCFGANVDGALGSGDEATHLSPVAVASAVGFDSLAAGQNHACGLEHGTGAVWCWGYNASGQLGVGDTTGRDAPVRLAQPGVAQSRWRPDTTMSAPSLPTTRCGAGATTPKGSWGKPIFPALRTRFSPCGSAPTAIGSRRGRPGAHLRRPCARHDVVLGAQHAARARGRAQQ